MEALRDHRLTVPGVVFGLLLLLAFHEKLPVGEQAKGLVIVSGAIASFALGFPFATLTGLIVRIIPGGLCGLTIPTPTSDADRAEIAKYFGVSKDDDEQVKDCISTLHHTMLTANGLSFLSRRLNGFFVDVNTIGAIIGGVAIAKLYGKCVGSELTAILFASIILLTIHAKIQLSEHKRLSERVHPIIMGKLRAQADEMSDDKGEGTDEG